MNNAAKNESNKNHKNIIQQIEVLICIFLLGRVKTNIKQNIHYLWKNCKYESL